MQICIAGAGAIGCTLAARIAAAGHNVNVFARGKNLQTLQRDGIQLTDLDGTFHVRVNASDNVQQLGQQDVILVCTKAHSLAAVLRSVKPMMHDDTIIIPVVNGIPWWYFQGIDSRFCNQPVQAVDAGGELLQLIGEKHLIGSVVFITAVREAEGIVHASNPHLMIIGEISHRLTERVTQLRDVLASTGMEVRACDDIRDQIWTKIAANLTSNPLSVITRATLQQLYSDSRLSPLVRNILNEVLTAAAAYSARIRFDPQTIMEMGTGMGAVRTSMLQDFEAGNALELAAIGEAVVELADKAGVSMPFTRSILALTDFIAEPKSSALN